MSEFFAVIASAAATGEAHAQGGFNIWTFTLSLINIIILFYLLKLILFKHVTRILNNRRERIRKEIEDAKEEKDEADKLKKQYEERIQKAEEEAEQIVNESRKKAQMQANEILEDARRESEQILNKATQQGEKEIEDALESAKEQITSLAIQAATKVIQENMDSETNRKLVEEFIDEEGVA